MDRDNASLVDIDSAAKRIVKFSEGLTIADLASDEEKQSAIIYQIIIIGEATKRLSNNFRANHPSIPWKDIAGMRDILAHQYDTVNIRVLWDVIKRDTPELIELIAPLLH